jgi:ferric-dicitrate binding protein FerR (iron transport regulator)
MDFGLVALITVAAGKVLDYVAPRTKNTVDDKIRGAFQWALGFLPFVNKNLSDAVDKAKQEPAVVVARTGPQVRDHR